jgi:hypothetical protein
MTNTTQQTPPAAPGKKPLDPHLFSGPEGSADDVRVQSGYPIWNLIGAWMASHQSDDEVITGYNIPREEWEAAKQYYLDHKLFIDARIIANSQPAADDDVPPMRTADEYFAWLEQQEVGMSEASVESPD